MSDHETIYKPITYEEFKKILKELIERQKRELSFYAMMMGQDVVTFDNKELTEQVREYTTKKYQEKFMETLDALIENLDLLYLIEQDPESYVFLIDHNGTPYAVWLGKTAKKILQRLYNNNILYI